MIKVFGWFHIHGIALGLVIQVAAEEGKEVVHLSLEKLLSRQISVSLRSWPCTSPFSFLSTVCTYLLVVGVLDGLGEVGQSIAHLSSGDVG